MWVARWGRMWLAAAVVATATGCSVADYEKPVTDFTDATRNAEAALVALDAQVTQDYETELRALVLSPQATVNPRSGNCNLTSERCRLEIIFLDPGRGPESFPPDPLLGNMVRLMGAIRTYADNLAAIVGAETAELAATHVNAAMGSVENLAATIVDLRGESEPPDISDYTTSAGQAINWVLGHYVDKVKLDGLRRATEAAQPVVADAAALFESAAEIAADIPKEPMIRDVKASLSTFEESGAEADLAALVEDAAAYDRYLTAKPSDVFAKLREAHDALADKLKGEDLTLATVMARIESFAAEAQAFFEIVREIRAAGDN